jgi:cytochrome P450
MKLTFVLTTALRMAYGTAQRSPRSSDTMPITYKDYVIPPKTEVSMDIYSISHDENIFPDSHTFKPERWADKPRAPDGKQLNRYMASFGRGARSCLGINLAYAELYIAVANIYRRFEFELFETDRTAVDCYRDMFVPQPNPGSLGVRTLVK